MKTPIKFPHQVEALAAWRGVIYKSTSRGRDYYKLVYRNGENGDGRKTLGFDSIEATMAGVKDLLLKLPQADGDSLVLSGNDALQYRQAMEALSKLDNPPTLNLAIADYIEAAKLLPGVSLREAAKFYAKRHGVNLPRRTVTEAVTEMLKAKRAEKLSERHIDDLDSRLSRFAKDFNNDLCEITGPTVAAWIRGLNLSPRSQNNYRMAIQTLVVFAKESGYLPKDWDEMDTVTVKKWKKSAPEIFTPKEIKALLKKANGKLGPYVAIGAFAGVRQAELERLDWSKIDLNRGYITIDASIAKTSSRRVIPMSDNLKLWLAKHKRKQGPVCGYQNVTNELLKLAKDAEIEWKTNGLRHSFGSYRTAQTNDIPRVSYEMGNSPAMVKTHYMELVTPEQAKEWFAVVP